jgi:superfamily II DNA or RNA helicase
VVAFPTNELTLSQAHPVGIIGWRQDVANLLPQAKDLVLDGERVLVIPHNRDESKLLSNLGIKTPNPIFWRYDWPGAKRPFKHQKITSALLVSEPRAFVLNGLGTGKTRSVLFAFDYLKQQGLVQTMLVVAPLSTLRDTWADEIRNVFPHLTAGVLTGSADQRLKMLKEPRDIMLINHDALRNFGGALAAHGFDIVVADELTAFKNATAKRSKALRVLTSRARFAWGLTGTPASKGPEDVHGQVLAINPERMTRSARAWKQKTMTQVSNFKWVPKVDAMETVWAAMQPAVRLSNDELDLPPMVTVKREAIMSARQHSTYKQVMDKLQADFNEGAMKVANEAVKRNKLLQISSGFAYTDEGIAAFLDPAPRLAVIAEAIEQTDAKFIVFCPFTAGVDIVHEHLKNLGLGVEKLDGRTPERQRAEIFRRFHDDPATRGIVAHPGTMSHGLTLVEANLIIWAAPVDSLETYDQGNGRIHRPGQTRSQTIVQVWGSTVERRVYQRLTDRATMQGVLLDMFDEQATPTF